MPFHQTSLPGPPSSHGRHRPHRKTGRRRTEPSPMPRTKRNLAKIYRYSRRHDPSVAAGTDQRDTLKASTGDDSGIGATPNLHRDTIDLQRPCHRRAFVSTLSDRSLWSSGDRIRLDNRGHEHQRCRLHSFPRLTPLGEQLRWA